MHQRICPRTSLRTFSYTCSVDYFMKASMTTGWSRATASILALDIACFADVSMVKSTDRALINTFAVVFDTRASADTLTIAFRMNTSIALRRTWSTAPIFTFNMAAKTNAIAYIGSHRAFINTVGTIFEMRALFHTYTLRLFMSASVALGRTLPTTSILAFCMAIVTNASVVESSNRAFINAFIAVFQTRATSDTGSIDFCMKTSIALGRTWPTTPTLTFYMAIMTRSIARKSIGRASIHTFPLVIYMRALSHTDSIVR